MSFLATRALDGYVLVTAANSFVVPWLDFHSSPSASMMMVFTSALADGYATLEVSNDRANVWTDGKNYPASAQFVGTYGKGPLGDPLDLATKTGSSTLITAATSPFVSGLPGVVYDISGLNFRWARIKYVAVNNVATSVTVTFSYKSTS